LYFLHSSDKGKDDKEEKENTVYGEMGLGFAARVTRTSRASLGGALQRE